MTTSNLPWFMDLTFQVPMQYCSLLHWTLLLSPVTSTTRCCCWLHLFILSGVISPLISSSILGTYRPGEVIFRCPTFLPFHTVLGFSRQEYWSGLPFFSPVYHVLSELSTMTHLSWVVLHGMAHSFIELDKAGQEIWKTQQWPQDWKRSFFTPIPKKGNAKKCSNYCIIALISHTSKVMFKILQTRLQQYVNHELPDVQAGFWKAEEPEIKLPISVGSSKKQESSRKTSISALSTMPKPLTVWITTNWKILQELGNQITWPASWEICMQFRKQQLELDMEQLTGSK